MRHIAEAWHTRCDVSGNAVLAIIRSRLVRKCQSGHLDYHGQYISNESIRVWIESHRPDRRPPIWTSDAASDGDWPNWAVSASNMGFWHSKTGERTITRAATCGCRRHHARQMTGLSSQTSAHRTNALFVSNMCRVQPTDERYIVLLIGQPRPGARMASRAGKRPVSGTVVGGVLASLEYLVDFYLLTVQCRDWFQLYG